MPKSQNGRKSIYTHKGDGSAFTMAHGFFGNTTTKQGKEISITLWNDNIPQTPEGTLFRLQIRPCSVLKAHKRIFIRRNHLIEDSASPCPQEIDA